jgi:predicted transcriptional regulator
VAAFGDLEAAIMDVVWAAEEPVRVRQIVERLRRDRAIAYTTVQTVMEILYRTLYWAAASAEDYTAGLMEDALATAPDRTAALVHLIGRMDPAEVAELRRAIAGDDTFLTADGAQ